MWRDIRWQLYDLGVPMLYRLKRLQCFLTGHKVGWGERLHGCQLAPDYCKRCYMDDPQDAMVLTDYLNDVYVWVVDRNWRWFLTVDYYLYMWILDHRPGWLPSWWEY